MTFLVLELQSFGEPEDLVQVARWPWSKWHSPTRPHGVYLASWPMCVTRLPSETVLAETTAGGFLEQHINRFLE